MKKDYKFEELHQYIRFDNDILSNNEKREILVDIVNNVVHELKTELSKNNAHYKILFHKELIGTNIISNFKYDDYSQVYYLIFNGKIETTFVIKNDKIISFFYSLTKNKSHFHPWLLN